MSTTLPPLPEAKIPKGRRCIIAIRALFASSEDGRISAEALKKLPAELGVSTTLVVKMREQLGLIKETHWLWPTEEGEEA